MNKLNPTVLLTIMLFSLCWAGVDKNPLSTGATQTRNALGRAFEASSENPALLGVDRPPTGGILIPLGNIGVGAWSDKLALSPFNRYWVDSLREGSALMSKIFRRSFDLDGLTDEQVSDRLTKELKGGLRAYTGFRTSLLSYAMNRVGFDVTTHFDEELQLPEGLLYALFSRDKGLLPGNTLDFSKLNQNAIWATDFTFSFGLPVSIPALHDFFKLRYGAGGIGVKYILGHSILRSQTEEGSVTFDDANNVLDVKGKVNIQTAGLGFSGPWNPSNPFENGFAPVSGHGLGVDLGGILYDDHGTMTVNVSNLGVIFWLKDVKQVSYYIDKNDLDVYDFIQKNDNLEKNMSDKGDTLIDQNGFVTVLPIALNIGYAYSWDFSSNPNKKMWLLSKYANVSANYEQALAKGPGRSFIPRISVGGENGTLDGFLPFRMGFVFGGPERIASALGAGFNFRYVSINAAYKALGTPFFYPKRGVELAAGLNVNWGMRLDWDHDGIIDKLDKCPRVPEDKDGFEDSDGCPDYDNDQDGIPDSLDKCPNVAEDMDGYEDKDGCPDYDNDKDGIPDSLDKCPTIPEDIDGFEDKDGCPDYDNDKDGIPDTLDKCPNVAEDLDGFEDADGCPDYDNDKDGIPDSVDQCPNAPETFNGYKDDDGCPDTIIKPTEKETKALNTKLRDINFKTGSAELITASYVALNYIADFLKQYPYLRYEIQGHTDSQGSDEYNLLLSAARAGTVRSYLLSRGIPDSSLIAIGYGKTVPIADNSTAAGRALNRRVEFRIIETNDEYSALKVREAEFKEKVRNAQIKGASY
jgi:outer membrane protein OmpA-like peptidoglycan-associated protein